MDKKDPESFGDYLLDSEGLAERAAQQERAFIASCPWKVNAETMVLYIPREGDRSYYELDLADCTSSAGVLNWIAQVSQKTWIDDATLGLLVRKLDQLFDLQATLCGEGVHRNLDPTNYLRKRGRLV